MKPHLSIGRDGWWIYKYEGVAIIAGRTLSAALQFARAPFVCHPLGFKCLPLHQATARQEKNGVIN